MCDDINADHESSTRFTDFGVANNRTHTYIHTYIREITYLAFGRAWRFVRCLLISRTTITVPCRDVCQVVAEGMVCVRVCVCVCVCAATRNFVIAQSK